MNINEIYNYIDTFAPFSTQDSFDNSGLLVKNEITEITRAAVCLDITNAVIDEAYKAGAQLIISHHPVIFRRPSSLDTNSPVFRLVKLGLSAICVHTPIDMANGGISDMMYELMGYGSPKNAPVLHTVHHDLRIGYGKIKTLDEPISAAELAHKAKAVFACDMVQYTDGGKPIKTVAVCSGAGNDEIYTCIEKDVDALITGDIKWHGFVDAKNAGLTVIDAGHYNTEVIVCDSICKRLSEHFTDVEFFIPTANRDCTELLYEIIIKQ